LVSFVYSCATFNSIRNDKVTVSKITIVVRP
jgi:hypothetical protein